MLLAAGLAGAEVDGVDHGVAVDGEVEGVAEATVEVGVACAVFTRPIGVVVEDAGDDGEAEGDLALGVVGEVAADGGGLHGREREAADIDFLAAVGRFDGGGVNEVLHFDLVHVGEGLSVGAHLPVVGVAGEVHADVGVVGERNVGPCAGGEFDIGGFVAPAVAEFGDGFGGGDPGEGAEGNAEVGGVDAVGFGDEGEFVGRLHGGGFLEGGGTEEGAVGRASRVGRVDLALEVGCDVLRSDQPAAFGGVLVPEARAAVDGEDVGLFVGDFGEGSDVAFEDALLLVAPADEVVHVEPHPELGGAEDGAVGVEVVVGGGGGGEAEGAATGDVGL